MAGNPTGPLGLTPSQLSNAGSMKKRTSGEAGVQARASVRLLLSSLVSPLIHLQKRTKNAKDASGDAQPSEDVQMSERQSKKAAKAAIKAAGAYS